jgi:anti-anti-sigma regulatory factor
MSTREGIQEKRMSTRITQIESSRSEKTTERGGRGDQPNISDSEVTVLKVEGSLYLKDAELLENICRDIGSRTQRPVALDLADLSFLDSDSASVLYRLTRDQGVRLQGLDLFIEKVVELAEESERVARYRPR